MGCGLHRGRVAALERARSTCIRACCNGVVCARKRFSRGMAFGIPYGLDPVNRCKPSFGMDGPGLLLVLLTLLLGIISVLCSWTEINDRVGFVLSLQPPCLPCRHRGCVYRPGHVSLLFLLGAHAPLHTGALFHTRQRHRGVYISRSPGNRKEFYILVLLASIGSSVLASSAHMASFFLGIELLGVSLYGLVAYNRASGRGIEAGIKYIVLAAVASGFLLFGMALVYAEAGTLYFSGISRVLYSRGSGSALLTIGSAMILIGVGFKLGLAPFHLWTPGCVRRCSCPCLCIYCLGLQGGRIRGSAPLFHAI